MKIHLSSAAETMSSVISLWIGRKIDLEVFPSSACPSARPFLVDAISQERLGGVSTNAVQMSAWTQGWTDSISVVKGQVRCSFTKHMIGDYSPVHMGIMTKLNTNV